MTFDTDFVQLDFGPNKVVRVTCKSCRVHWPPPPVLTVLGFKLRRMSISKISDAERAANPFVSRGAAYEVI